MDDTTTPAAAVAEAPPSAGAAAPGGALVGPDHDPRLSNPDLAPLRHQSWRSYNFLAFWMSDVHSVGGYVTAGSLFALGLAGWQVFVALLVGIAVVYALCNLVTRPSQSAAVPYPVVARLSFGVLGANVPAVIRGLIAVAWYGIQTYLASQALVVLALRLDPGLAPYADVDQHGFLGLHTVGWAAFAVMWVVQALVFWRGMEAIRKFIDFCGPAVYVVMLALAVYLVVEAGGFSALSFTLGDVSVEGWSAVPVMATAVALVVSYFSGPMLNYGDFARYGRSFAAVRRGNLLGLPVNFLVFALLVVVTASATVPVYGRLITDPVETVAQMSSLTAVVLGTLTFVIATVGINIVANFVAPAFDFSHVSPQRISWRTGGMIAAVGSVLITPWNLYSSPQTIHVTLDTLGAFIGPLYGVLIADYYLVRRRTVVVDDLYTMRPDGRYHYRRGVNPRAVGSLAAGAVLALALVFLAPAGLAAFSWFVGAGVGFVAYRLTTRPHAPGTDLATPSAVVGG